MNASLTLVIQMPLAVILQDHSNVYAKMDFKEMAPIVKTNKSAMNHQKITAISMLIVRMTSQGHIHVSAGMDTLEMALVVRI